MADLLRFVTAGSVDSGKSTLIGRLLFDSKQIFDDQLLALEQASVKRSRGFLDLSLLTDGLRAEREQGITIDVAYRYFSTPARKFVIADTPGHVQYTRNMVTGASSASLCVLVVEVNRGLLEQTRRHATVAGLLGVRSLVIAVNKMDMVGFAQEAFDRLCAEMRVSLEQLPFEQVTFIPVSALHGDNIVERSDAMPWYDGPAVLEYLESVPILTGRPFPDLRLPIQLVLRPDPVGGNMERFYAGRLAGGSVAVGDPVVVLPSGASSRIRSIVQAGEAVGHASTPESVAVSLEDDLDISRGYMLASPDRPPRAANAFTALVCWLADRPLVPGSRYALKHTTAWSRVIVRSIQFRYDVHDLTDRESAISLAANDIGCVDLTAVSPLYVDPYEENRATGSFILVDEVTNETVAAGMIGTAGD